VLAAVESMGGLPMAFYEAQIAILEREGFE